MVQKSRLRVGAVSFLNTKPLIYPLLNGELPTDNLVLSVHVPSRLATLLSEGELDVGLIPIIEYFRARDPGAGYCILPGISIASQGSVQSIQLFSRVPIQDIQRIALDTSSRSSIALLKILLAEKYRIHPEFTSCPPSVAPAEAEAEAVLLIGDAALKHLGATEYSVDLGAEWHELTGLPFVYACWVARGGVCLGDTSKLLCKAKAKGIEQIPEIARIEARKLGLSETLCRNYLQHYIHYDLDESAIAGIELFYKLAVKNGLAAPGRVLSFIGNIESLR